MGMTHIWDDELTAWGTRPRLWFVTSDGVVHPFLGHDLPGVAVIAGRQSSYQHRGPDMVLRTEYAFDLAEGVTPVTTLVGYRQRSICEDCSTWEQAATKLGVSISIARLVLRRASPRAARRIDASTPPVVVTRHAALIDYLVEINAIPPGTPHLTHATPEQIKNRDVIGVLPLHLAALCRQVTEVPLDLPPDARGRELTLDEVRQYAGAPVTYQVRRVS